MTRRPPGAGALLLAIVLLGGCSVLDGLFDSGNVFELAVGDCFDDGESLEGESGEVSDVPVVDCAEPHDNEVIHVFDLPDGDFPGTEVVGATADETCASEFAAYVGTPYQDSELQYFPLTPTEDSWATIGDREVVCVVFDATGAELEGSVRGSGR